MFIMVYSINTNSTVTPVALIRILRTKHGRRQTTIKTRNRQIHIQTRTGTQHTWKESTQQEMRETLDKQTNTDTQSRQMEIRTDGHNSEAHKACQLDRK